jgi:hypothetical protein
MLKWLTRLEITGMWSVKMPRKIAKTTVQQFAEEQFEDFRFEYQLFKSKPVLYRKYRPSFLLLGKK